MSIAGAAASGNASPVAAYVVTYVVLFALYWAPAVIAGIRHVRGLGQVIVVNLFLGWTGVGWVVALVMAFRHVPSPAQSAGGA